MQTMNVDRWVIEKTLQIRTINRKYWKIAFQSNFHPENMSAEILYQTTTLVKSKIHIVCLIYVE
jgi:hypothetical protein